MTHSGHPHNALPKGHRLHEYELVRVLGVGSFGITYLGFDHNLDKGVAIKEYLPSDLATRTPALSVVPQASHFRDDFQWGLERFAKEARTLAFLKDHPNIIKVHRLFEAHDTAYIVMEYAEGETLAAYLRHEAPLSEAALKKILYPLLDGLELVHEADILHRDIKPPNIVIRDEDDSPVLLDFGAARQALGERSHSFSVIVTPGYAPIEQYWDQGHQGAWTDIYALGAVCYRALTNEVPDAAPARTQDDPLDPVSKRCAGRVSGGFLSAIDAALRVDERDRPQSVAEWREMLERPDDPPDDPIVDPNPKPRRWTLVAIVALVGALVLGSLSSWYIFQDRPHDPEIVRELEELERYEKVRDAAVDADDPQPLKDYVARYPKSPYVSRAEDLIQTWDKQAD